MADNLEDSGSSAEMVGGCCVCSDEHGWDENPLVYCDGEKCNVAVHQACYGIITVPPGPWFCRKCESGDRAGEIRCEFCPSSAGAMKRTDNDGWAHVICSLYIPEVRFGNVSSMEPIIVSLVPRERYAKTCYLCELRSESAVDFDLDAKSGPGRYAAHSGACMSCNKIGCKQSFHVTCAQSAGLLCEEAGNNMGNVKYCGYCEYHYQRINKKLVKTIPAYKHPKVKIESAEAIYLPTPVSVGVQSRDQLPAAPHLPPTVVDNLNRQRRRSSVDAANLHESASRRSEVVLAERAGSTDDAIACRLTSSARSTPFNRSVPMSVHETHASESQISGLGSHQSAGGNKVVLKLSKRENGIYCTTPSPSHTSHTAQQQCSSSSATVSRSSSPLQLQSSAPDDCQVPSPPLQDLSLASELKESAMEVSANEYESRMEGDSHPTAATEPLSLKPSTSVESTASSSVARVPNLVESSDRINADRQQSTLPTTNKSQAKRVSATGKRLGRPPKKGTHIAQSAVPQLMQLVKEEQGLASEIGSHSVPPAKDLDLAHPSTDIIRDGVQSKIAALAKFNVQSSQPPVWMLGAKLNESSSMAQEMMSCLSDEIKTVRTAINSAREEGSDNFVPERSAKVLVGAPFPDPVRQSDLHEEIGGNIDVADLPDVSDDVVPASLDGLLCQQWERSSNFLMEQAAHAGLATKLSELHTLKMNNRHMTQSIDQMQSMCDHLTALNGRLSVTMSDPL